MLTVASPSARRCKAAPYQCRRRVHCFASTGTASPVDQAVSVLKQASQSPKVPSKDVFQALRTVQKAKLPADGWGPIIGCNKNWRLVYTADKSAVQKSMTDDSAGNGYYFPLTAAQLFDLDGVKGRLQNGVYIPYVASLQFLGDCEMKGARLPFSLTGVKVQLGPFKLGPFDISSKSPKAGGKQPFFIFFYADDDIICAQGASGGIAMWAKASPEWELQKGLA